MNLKPVKTLRTNLSMKTLERLEKESNEACDRLIDARRRNASQDVINGYNTHITETVPYTLISETT